MFGKIKNLIPFAGIVLCLAFFAACDMGFVPSGGSSGSGNPSDPRAPGVSASGSFLTILNLPANISARNITNVQIHNLAKAVAKCSDYSLIEISVDNDKAIVRIPLIYQDSPEAFAETGYYYVSFDINVDVTKRYNITKNDKVQASFIRGNGILDIDNLADPPVPYVTIQGLPLHTTNKHFSDISVYNQASVVASCVKNDDIIIFKGSDSSIAMIPLSYSSGDPFLDTGLFVFTFTVNVDFETQISFNRNDLLTLYFSNGTAFLDLASGLGFFDAQLVNPSDTDAPRIKGNSSFDINGMIVNIPADTSIDSALPAEGCVIYLYAYRVGNDVMFEYSTQSPVYLKGKGGYYNGTRRALWKMLFLPDDGNKFLFKTYIDNQWPHLATNVIGNSADLTSPFPVIYSLSGSNNPSPGTITLQPGMYAIRLTGAGGGGGFGSIQNGSISGSSSGGSGGIITEILTLSSTVTFTTFTGSGGRAAVQPSPSGGGFDFIGYSILVNVMSGNIIASVVVSRFGGNNYGLVSGGGAGGGGSGSFLYSDKGYLLVAGGGGGGSGGSFLTPGGAGGAGGSIGSGGGGGAAGYLRQIQTYNGGNDINGASGGEPPPNNSTFTAFGGNGGNGGGNGAGAGGSCTSASSAFNGSNGAAHVSTSTFSYNGSYSSSYSAATLNNYLTKGNGVQYNIAGSSINPPNPNWLIRTHETSSTSGSGGSAAYNSNTGSANGQGAGAPSLGSITGSGFSISIGGRVSGNSGSDGGNNRNTSKGGGAVGGIVANDRPSDGAAGSITIHKIN